MIEQLYAESWFWCSKMYKMLFLLLWVCELETGGYDKESDRHECYGRGTGSVLWKFIERLTQRRKDLALEGFPEEWSFLRLITIYIISPGVTIARTKSRSWEVEGWRVGLLWVQWGWLRWVGLKQTQCYKYQVEQCLGPVMASSSCTATCVYRPSQRGCKGKVLQWL